MGKIHWHQVFMTRDFNRPVFIPMSEDLMVQSVAYYMITSLMEAYGATREFRVMQYIKNGHYRPIAEESC